MYNGEAACTAIPLCSGQMECVCERARVCFCVQATCSIVIPNALIGNGFVVACMKGSGFVQSFRVYCLSKRVLYWVTIIC